MRFDLIQTVKDICNHEDFIADNGASYFIPGLNIEFNPRSDDSLHQSIYVEYNPTLTNEGDETYEMVDQASLAAQTLIIDAFEETFDKIYPNRTINNEIKVQNLIEGVTVATCNAHGISLLVQASDMGFYATFTETLY